MNKLAVGAMMIFASSAAWASVLTVSDSSFETFNVLGGYAYSGNMPGYVPGWTFDAGAGVAAQGSAFNVPSTPDGIQAGFLQGNGSTVAQSIGGFDASMIYVLDIWVGTRFNGPPTSGNAGVTFYIDGIQIGTTGILPSFTPFTEYQIPFTVAVSGAHNLSLTNLSGPGDNTSFVDNVQINGSSVAPEPATFVLFGGALVGLGLIRRRRR